MVVIAVFVVSSAPSEALVSRFSVSYPYSHERSLSCGVDPVWCWVIRAKRRLSAASYPYRARWSVALLLASVKCRSATRPNRSRSGYPGWPLSANDCFAAKVVPLLPYSVWIRRPEPA